MRILGIESSCDETAAAVVEDGVAILSSVVASQLDTHGRYGGVVPELASREHLRAIVPVTREALDRAQLRWRTFPPSRSPPGPDWSARCWWASPTPKRCRSPAGFR
jgi:N6-L-threonylcarbamoyladenine synthase